MRQYGGKAYIKPALFFVFCCISLCAAPIGNPDLPFLLQKGCFLADTNWSHPQCGYSRDYLWQKRFQSPHLSKISLRGISDMGLASWTIAERFSLQAQLGSGQFTWRMVRSGRALEGQLQGGLLWSGDAKLIIIDMKDTAFSADAQAGGWDWMDGPTTANALVTANNTSLLRYWQVALALTQKIGLFSPYLGMAVNRTRFKLVHLGYLHARHDLGPFVGCSFSSGSYFLLNCEWRGWFEEGFSLSAQVRF